MSKYQTCCCKSNLERSTAPNIEVIPRDSTSAKIVASIHLVTDTPFTYLEDKLAAREAILIGLNSISVSELSLSGSVEMVKHHLTTKMKEYGPIGGINIQGIYIANLVVVYVGPSINRTYKVNK